MTESESVTATALTLENERLRTELRACRQRAADAAEATRAQIERNLHDGLQQRLVSLALSLGLLDAKLPHQPGAAKPIAGEARRSLSAALGELRELTQGLYPSALTEHGLTVALEELCDRLPVYCDRKISLDDPPPAEVAAAIYFTVSEALTNVTKHAAASEIRVLVSRVDDQLIAEVHDDGIGGAASAHGSGLRGLAGRIDAVGGRLTVSSPRGFGTTIRAEIPSEQRNPPA
jgi:signal transduction histidine kinase